MIVGGEPEDVEREGNRQADAPAASRKLYNTKEMEVSSHVYKCSVDVLRPLHLAFQIPQVQSIPMDPHHRDKIVVQWQKHLAQDKKELFYAYFLFYHSAVPLNYLWLPASVESRVCAPPLVRNTTETAV